ncbi:hypothetical protein J2Z65_007048 [Paenibacillus aceris]|uniref:Uncharacterized protein n=1 Tax=Paenibacillus aceris TaxID=869555 RepID=A0ABS4IA08_9BACL|nr:hypothetical protein [Paenibacillus aceris]
MEAGKGILATNGKLKSDSQSIVDHVLQQTPENSPWISTTRSLVVAQTDYNKSGYGVVAIDLDKVKTEWVDAAAIEPTGREV